MFYGRRRSSNSKWHGRKVGIFQLLALKRQARTPHSSNFNYLIRESWTT